MTRLTKPVRRELDVIFDGRPGIVIITPEGVYLRPKGRVKKYLLPWGHAYLRAGMLEADRMRREREERRRERGLPVRKARRRRRSKLARRGG